MMVELKHALRRYRGQILGWGIGLALLGLLLVPMYDNFADQQDAFQQMLDLYPEDLMAFFGDMGAMASPEGWLSIEFFSYMPLILGIFAIQAGSGLLVRDEEEGTLDLVMAHPVSRSALFLGRLLAFLLALAAVLGIAWLGMVVPMGWSTMSLGWGALARPFLSLYGEMVLFGALSLFSSMIFPSRRWASMASGLFLVASYFINGLAQINENLEPVARFSPLNYYQTQSAFAGLNLEWLMGLLAVAVGFVILSWWRFQTRDLRVAGEGGWRVPDWFPGSRRRIRRRRQAN